MHTESIFILVAYSTFGLLVVHIFAVRFFSFLKKPVSRQLVAIGCVLAGNVPVVGIFLLSPPAEGWLDSRTLANLFYFLIVYNALGYSYFHLFNMSETARRIRILCEIDEFGTLDSTELAGRYGGREMIAARLERLVALGQLVRQGDRYLSKNSWLYYSALVVVEWKRLLKL
jgi:hypothetical protein